MAFDPYKYGAKPATNSSFDPTKYGARPVGDSGISTGFPKEEPPEIKRNFLQKTAGFLGMEKFGQGIASATRVLTGEVGEDLDRQIQESEGLQKLVDAARKETDPEKKNRLLQAAKNIYGVSISAEEIDPGLKLTNKEVLGSALNTAALVGTAGLPGAKTLVGKVGQGAAVGYTFDVANKATQNKDNVFKPGVATVVGAALPIVTKTLGALTKKTLGATSGVGKPVIDRAVKNPNQVNAAIRRYAQDDASKMNLVEKSKEAIRGFLNQRNTEFGAKVSKTTFTKPFTKKEIISQFSDDLAKFNGKITKNGLKFQSSSLTKADQNDIIAFYKQLKSWKDFTPSGIENLRQAIGNNISQFKAAGNTRADVVLGGLKKFVTNGLEQRAPGYKQILGEYGKKTGLAKNLVSELNQKGNAKPQTQLNSIMRIFKKDPQILKDLTVVMGKEQADMLLDDITGAILSDALPSGLARQIIEGNLSLIGLYGIITGAVPLPGFIAATASASPRIVGEGATLVGKALQKGVGTAIRRAATIGSSKLSK